MDIFEICRMGMPACLRIVLTVVRSLSSYFNEPCDSCCAECDEPRPSLVTRSDVVRTIGSIVFVRLPSLFNSFARSAMYFLFL